MSILLCAATEFEIAPTIQYINNRKLSDGIKVCITGVGLTAACYNITKNIILHKPKFAIQAGIAGTLSTDLKLAQAVVVGSETIGDSGVFENSFFKSLFDLGLANKQAMPFQNSQLINKNEELLKLLPLHQVTAVSVNEITTNTDRIEYYKNNLSAAIETLEGAAFHYVCLAETVPFLQLRTVSNTVGERDKKRWMLTESISELNNQLQQLIDKLIQQ